MTHPEQTARDTRRAFPYVIGVALMGALVAAIALAPGMTGSRPLGSPVKSGLPSNISFVLLNDWVDQPGTVLALDTGSGVQGASVATAHDPAFALAPDRDRVYLASGQDADGRFTVIDALTGETVHEEPLPVRWLNTMPAYFPSITVSPDGRSVYVLASDSVGPGRDAYYVRVFDTTTEKFLDEPLGIPCVAPLVLPGADVIHAACPHSGLVLSTPVGTDRQFGVTATAEVSESGIKGLIAVPGSSDLLALTAKGRVVRLGEAGAVHLFQVPGVDTDLVYDAFAISPDGATIYIGRPAVSTGRIGAIESYDVSSGKLLAKMHLPVEAWTFEVDPESGDLFLPAHDAGRLLTLDGSTLEVRGDLKLPGKPTMVVP